jgi:hypothetical protein
MQGPLLVPQVDVLLLLEGLLLAQLELASLQQFVVRTVAVQGHQLNILADLLLGGVDKLLQQFLLHDVLKRQFGLAVLLVGLDEVVEHLRALLDHEGH